jgi:uncharacterized protein (DUF2235 family)
VAEITDMEAIRKEPTRPRKLIVCCDGTWNQRDSASAPTNVAKMARAISPVDQDGRSQLIYYHPGVGTGNWLDQKLGGWFGVGLSENVRSAYAFLADNFRIDDEIFLFGFSRGAFTARSLAGLIGLVGVLRKIDMEYFAQIYDIYTSRAHRSAVFRSNDEQTPLDALRNLLPDGDANGRNERIMQAIGRARRTKFFFVGVWDTIGSLGVPWPFSWVTRSKFKFHDTDLNENITYAYHALAIEERRGPFKPTLWTKPIRPAQERPQVVEQVWFSGAHANVGGGYDDAGLSDIAFLWMVDKAASAAQEKGDRPLAFEEDYLQEKINRTMGTLINSTTKLYKWMPECVRSVGEPAKSGYETCEQIHHSVFVRCDSQPGKFEPFPYRPDNIARFIKDRTLLPTAEPSELELKYRPRDAP